MKKIDWVENKTLSSGKPYKRASVTDEEGKQYTNVAIFGTFPNFADIAGGSEVEGEIENKEYNGQPSYSLNGPKSAKASFAKKDISKSVEEAQKRTDVSVDKAQTRTETSVQLAGAQRDAVLVVTTIINQAGMSFPQDDGIKKMILDWRNWFLSGQFKDTPPF